MDHTLYRRRLANAALGSARKGATASRSVPDVPGAVAELSGSALLEEVTDRGPYPGFDTNLYPGDDAMRAWRDHAGYHWVGYYLLAPCHKDGSWQGKRDMLESMGWGVAVVYVGQQTWGRPIPARACHPRRRARRIS